MKTCLHLHTQEMLSQWLNDTRSQASVGFHFDLLSNVVIEQSKGYSTMGSTLDTGDSRA